jgi:hypothetical protein
MLYVPIIKHTFFAGRSVDGDSYCALKCTVIYILCSQRHRIANHVSWCKNQNNINSCKKSVKLSQHKVLDLYWPHEEWRSFGRVERRSGWRETKKIKSNWLWNVTRMNSKRMSNMLNYRQNKRRRLKVPLKRLLHKGETDLLGLIRDGWRWLSDIRLWTRLIGS